jgi:hypothetical protein
LDRQRRLPTIALIWFFALGFFLSGCASSSLDAKTEASVRIIPLTSRNRNYPGIMWGGWGPHLRALMRNSRDELWFVTDVGPDVQHNEQLIYHRFNGQSWHETATLNQIPGIQQNVASLMCGDCIYSYGISVREPLYVEECVFDTVSRQQKRCAPLEVGGAKLLLPPSCNYVGAALSPAGQKVVWWTTVGINGGEGKWSYIYEGEKGWKGPVVSTLHGFNDFGYVFASFSADGVMSITGQLYRGAYPNGSFALGAAELRLGEKLEIGRNMHAFSTNSMNAGKSAADIWIYGGATHVIAETQKGTLAYYFKPRGVPWSECDEPVCVLTNVHRARFEESAHSLSLISGSNDGAELLVRSVRKSVARTSVDWTRVKPKRIAIEPAFAWPSAVYGESRSYQTTKVKGTSFAISGHYLGSDSQIRFIELSGNANLW